MQKLVVAESSTPATVPLPPPSPARGHLYFGGVLSFIFGIALGSVFSLPWPALLFAGMLGVIFILARIITSRPTYVLLGIVCFGLVCGVARADLALRELPPEFQSLVGSTASLSGVVASVPDVRETTQRITVEVRESNSGTQAKTRVLAVVPLYTNVEVGDVVEIQGALTAPAPFATDGGRTFDYQKFLAKDGTFLLMQRAQLQVLSAPHGWYLPLAYLARVKNAFVDGLERALPEPYAALAVGLLTGGKQGLGKELLADFTTAGLVQIVVLSGYNVMVVAQFVLLLLRRFPKRVAGAVASIAIILFVLAAGAGTSAIRAGIMACLALYARASGRTYNALRALFAALVFMLLWNPLLLVYDPGLQLSVLATLGLILGSSKIEVWLAPKVRGAFWREAIATTLAAQIAVLPILLYDTGNLSLVSLPANVLVMAVTPAAMAAAFVAGLAGIIFAPVAPVLGLPAFALLWYIVEVAKVSAGLPFAHVIIPAFSFIFVVLAYGVLGWFRYKMNKRERVAAKLRPVLKTPQ